MFSDLMELTEQARAAYHEMVDALAKEVAQFGGIHKGSSGLFFSHLGHSRTPSGCSAKSFASSILSEPVPEPQSSPVDHSSNNNANDKPTISSTTASLTSSESTTTVQV